MTCEAIHTGGYKIIPVGTNIAIKVNPIEETTAGGIILTVGEREVPGEGIVVAVGPGAYSPSGELVPTQCEIGDYVMYSAMVGGAREINIPYNGHDHKYSIIKEENLYCIVKSDQAKFTLEDVH